MKYNVKGFENNKSTKHTLIGHAIYVGKLAPQPNSFQTVEQFNSYFFFLPTIGMG